MLVTTITALLIASDYARSKMPTRTKALVIATAGAAVIGAAIYANLQIHAGPAERTASLPGDELISNPVGVVNRAITIYRPPHDVWPWLAQMGSGRAGWYSYDFIDNGRVPSSKHILPEYQNVAVGTVFPALPGAKDVFVVLRCEPEHNLVLSWRLPDGRYQTTWAFVLEQSPSDQTRLIVRGRVAQGYRPFHLPQWLASLIGRPAHFITQRKQLVNIRQRAESTRG
jgi:hypothetical protein